MCGGSLSKIITKDIYNVMQNIEMEKQVKELIFN